MKETVEGGLSLIVSTFEEVSSRSKLAEISKLTGHCCIKHHFLLDRRRI